MGLLVSNYEANPITNNSVSISAVSGTLCKTFRKSFFITFEFDSKMEETVFDRNIPRLSDWYKDCDYFRKEKDIEEIVVLQVMLCGNDRVLVEVIKKDDYEEMFQDKESK